MAKILVQNEAASAKFRAEIESSADFKAVSKKMARAANSTKELLKQKMESNAEYQRRRSMSADEKAKGAIDRLAASIKTLNREARGKELTHEQCLNEAKRIAKMALGSKI